MKNKRINPAYSSGGKRKLLPSYCAFIDILGFKNQIREAYCNGRQEQFFQKLVESIKSSVEFQKLHKGGLESNYQFFSDCLVIGFSINENRPEAESEFGRILSAIGDHQFDMTQHGFFVRGGLAFGDLHIGKSIAFGNSFLDAFLVEENEAVYPRIVLAQSAIEKLKEHLNFYSEVSKSPHNHDLLVDENGKIFVNYLMTLIPDWEHVLTDCLENHRDAISKQLEMQQDNLKVFEKYEWLARYHNYFCRTFLWSPLSYINQEYQLIPATDDELEMLIENYCVEVKETLNRLFYRLSETYTREDGKVCLISTPMT